MARDVGDVSGIHPHLSPLPALRECCLDAVVRRVAQEIRHRAPLVVRVAAVLLELGEHLHRIAGEPVAEHHHVFVVVAERLRPDGVDDEWPVNPKLLLNCAMAVIPIRAVLTDRETIREGLRRPNARVADARHAVHAKWQDQAVPVDRGGLAFELIRHANHRVLPLQQPHERPRHGAVDRYRWKLLPADIEQEFANDEINGSVTRASFPRRAGVSGDQTFKCGEQTGGGGAADEMASVDHWAMFVWRFRLARRMVGWRFPLAAGGPAP